MLRPFLGGRHARARVASTSTASPPGVNAFLRGDGVALVALAAVRRVSRPYYPPLSDGLATALMRGCFASPERKRHRVHLRYTESRSRAGSILQFVSVYARRFTIALCNIWLPHHRLMLHKTKPGLRRRAGRRRRRRPLHRSAKSARASWRGVCATVVGIPPRAVRRGGLRSRARPTRRRRRRVARLCRLPSTRRRATRR